MALYPNTPFADGDSFTPDLAYLAFNAPVFDDRPEYLGHRLKIADSELSDSAGQIKDRVGFLESSLKVTQEGTSGLTVRYASGRVTLPNNTTLTVTSGLLAVSNNTVTYIYVDINGVPRAAARIPAISIPLAKVTAVNSAISQIEDMRHPNQKVVSPTPSAIKVFGGSSQVDLVPANGSTLKNGYHYCRDFFVPADTTVFVQGFARIFCSGSVNIAGNVVVNALAYGVPLTAYNLTQSGSVGRAYGAGMGSSGQSSVPWAAQPFGSGGSSGLIQCHAAASGWGYLGKGGEGGGGFWLEAAGDVTVSGSIQANGTGGAPGGNRQDSFPGGITSAFASFMASGSGGGSGGLIYLSSLLSIVATPTANLQVKGGRGADGLAMSKENNPIVALGGHGGSGGWVVISSPSNNVSGATIDLLGGIGGDCIAQTSTGSSQAYLTQPSPGVFRSVSTQAFLSGGEGGAYSGLSRPYLTSQQTEGGVGVQYFTRQASDAGILLLQNFSPIGA